MTIPNIITLLRLFMVPAVVYAMLVGEMGWAFAGFVAAGVSDAVDGFIARQFNQKSELGAYLDPAADKLLLVSVFVMLGIMGHLPLWLVVLAVSRDGLIVAAVLLGSVMGTPLTVRPLLVSKANTAVQIALAVIVLGELAFSVDSGLVGRVMVWLSGALTVASAAAYLVAWVKHMGGYDDRRNAWRTDRG